MKKHYLKPSLRVFILQPQQLIAASDKMQSMSFFEYEGSDEGYEEGAR
jgi:hypothetical protein